MAFSASNRVPFTQARANLTELANQANAGAGKSSAGTVKAMSR